MHKFLLFVFALGGTAFAEEPPANAAVYEQWICSEVAYWRIDALKRESPAVVREALLGEPTCTLASQRTEAISVTHQADSVEMVLPLSAATVLEAGYGVNLYLPIALDVTAPVH